MSRTKKKDMNNLSFEALPGAVATLTKEIKDLKAFLTEKLETEKAKREEEFLNVDQAAEFLDLAPVTIYAKVRNSEIPYIKRGRRLYFSTYDLQKYMRDGRSVTATEAAAAADEYIKKGPRHGK